MSLLGLASRTVKAAPRYAAFASTYWREAETVCDFTRAIRIRSALSPLGALAAPRPRLYDVSFPSVGGTVRLRSHSSDISVLSEVLFGAYADVAKHLTSCSRIVDLGANIGLSARWFLALHPTAHVVAVEPEPVNAALCRHNLRGRRASVVEAAIGRRDGVGRLYVDSPAWAYTTVGSGRAIDVRVRSMDSLLDEAQVDRVDLLKVDIEGAEHGVFEDCGQWIHKVNAIVVELHHGLTVPEFQDLLAGQGCGLVAATRTINRRYGWESALFL